MSESTELTEPTIIKELVVNGITISLKSNGRIYGKGRGYVELTVEDDEIILNDVSPTQIDMCVKDIFPSTLPNCIGVQDTRDGSYDLFVNKNNIMYELLMNKYYYPYYVVGLTVTAGLYVLSKKK